MPKRLNEIVNADREARHAPTRTLQRSIRRLAGISEAGMTQYMTRVPSGLRNVDKLRQVGAYMQLQ